jgi:3-phenylpropionate/trans-cinnamate dioxygenase ferredoxin reductase subunit
MTVLIIGAGQAATQTIQSLRQGGYAGGITLVGDEGFLPYQRPPLSKAYLSGKMERDRLFFKPQSFFDDNNVTLHLDARAEEIDVTGGTVICNGLGALAFDTLVLATGSRPRPLPLPSRALSGIFDLRGMGDIDAIQPHFQAGKSLAIIGGGYIGLEAAAVAAQSGLSVNVFEAAPRLLARVAEPEISDFFHRLHSDNGVQFHLESQIAGFTGAQNGGITGIEMASGDIIAADLAIVGIGILPNIELAEAAGLTIDNGILVDECGRTSADNIYAAGDCTQHPNDLLGRRMRLESVPNAIEQGKAVASAILGNPAPYHQVPWFWSDQYDIKLQIAGVPDKIDNKVLRGDDNGHSFAWFYFTGDRLTGVTAVNRPAEFMAGRQLIEKSLRDGLAVFHDNLRDETIKPKQWLT